MLGGRGKTATTEPNTFKRPSLEEIKAYIEERKSSVDPEAFYDYYTKIGWVYGKNKLPIKNWNLVCLLGSVTTRIIQIQTSYITQKERVYKND
jgi:hypothetical protein